MQIKFETSKGRFLAIKVIGGEAKLPSYKLEPIGLLSEITEDKAKEIVSYKSNHVFEKKYKDYSKKGIDVGFKFKKSLESFTSLMQSLGITDGEWIILKEVNN